MSKHKHGSAKDAHGHSPAAGHGAHGPDAEHAGHAGHAVHGHDADGAETHAHGPAKGTFATIFLVLAFLTVVEVFIPQVYNAPWNQNTKMLLLSILAIGKAMLVALFFMHLKWETPWLRRIALLPAYMGLAAIILMVETAWRNSLS